MFSAGDMAGDMRTYGQRNATLKSIKNS
eukprot:COSAG02_NODE_34589_length_481_cov_3.434555_2_plen_27_part_01